MYRKIIVATDLTPASDAAVRAALELARRFGARLTALHVAEPPYEPQHWFVPHDRETQLLREVFHHEQVEARARLKEQTERLGGRDGVSPELRVVAGVPADSIVDEAVRSEADLLVIGTHGRRGVQHALLGSIAERVVRTSKVPVLTVRSDAR